MLQRDYILRLIREFMAALQRMLEKKEIKERKEELKRLYNQYVGPYAFYHCATLDDVMEALAGEEEGYRMAKIEMLSELYYAESALMEKPEGDRLLSMAFSLYDYLEHYSRMFSWERHRKMADIRQRLSVAGVPPASPADNGKEA